MFAWLGGSVRGVQQSSCQCGFHWHIPPWTVLMPNLSSVRHCHARRWAAKHVWLASKRKPTIFLEGSNPNLENMQVAKSRSTRLANHLWPTPKAPSAGLNAAIASKAPPPAVLRSRMPAICIAVRSSAEASDRGLVTACQFKRVPSPV